MSREQKEKLLHCTFILALFLFVNFDINNNEMSFPRKHLNIISTCFGEKKGHVMNYEEGLLRHFCIISKVRKMAINSLNCEIWNFVKINLFVRLLHANHPQN